MGRNSEVIEISKDKVYTSYYARACKIIPDRLLVSISLGIPNNFNGEIYRKLNPTPKLLSQYKNGLVNSEEYTKIYYEEILNRLDANEVYNDLKGKVLLCYCGKTSFCHRKLVLEWIEKSIGIEAVGGEI